MKQDKDWKFSILIVLLLLYLITSPLLGNGHGESRLSADNTEIKKVPMEFSHTEDFLVQVPEKKIETEEFTGSEFLDALDEFNQTGVNVYHGADIIPGSTTAIPGSGSLSYLIVNITESYIYDRNEPILDSEGEIYYKIRVNGNYTRFPHEGEIEEVSDDTLIPLNVIGFVGWTWNNTVEVEVWEADTDADDYLGKILYSTGNPTDETLELQTDVGDANVTLQFIVAGTKNTLSAQDLLWGYQPYLYIDDETSGTEEPDGIYGRVCVGTDDSLSKTLWVLQYFFYWEKETYGTSPLEVQLHKYDYEEFLVFLDPADITTPIRLAFDEAQNPVYPSHEFVVYEVIAPSPILYNQSVAIPENLHPFLGINITIPYHLKDLSNLSTVPSQLGGQTFKMTVDTFYHALDSGEGSNEMGFNYSVQALSNEVLKDWYSHLNESLYGTIHNVPVIDYTTPEVSPFTFDVSNPFERPYIINAWSNVMEDLKAFTMAQTQDITMAADMTITITFAVEGVLTVEYPETLLPGQTYNLNYSIKMDDETVTMKTDYNLAMNLSANFWFLGGEFLLYQNGSLEVDIPLLTISSSPDHAGMLPKAFANRISDKISEYLSLYYLELDYITVSPQLLGTVLNASVRLHFWDIARDAIPLIVSALQPEIYPIVNTAFKVLDRIISHIDLQAIFLIETMITGDLALSDPTQAQLGQNTIEFNESATLVPITLTIDKNPTNPNLQMTLNEISNGMNFFIDWYFDAGLEPPFNWFIEDFRLSIGRFPSFEMALPNGWIVANVSSVSIDMTISGVTTTTTTTTADGAAGYSIFLTILVISAILLKKRTINKKSKSNNIRYTIKKGL